jgi:biotin operon repressor
LTNWISALIFNHMVEEQAAMNDVFHALAHDVRREMLGRLAMGQLTVGELAESLDMSLAAASKHVKVLERAGGAPGAGATRGRARRPPQQADGRLAVQPGDGHHLVQQPVFLRPRGAQIALPLEGGVLPQTGSGHGHLLVGIGNRDY